MQTLGEDGVGVDVGKDGEAFFDEDFRGFESFYRVGKEVGGIGMNFEFHPLGKSGGGGKAGEADGFLGIHGTAGVREE